MQTGQIRLANVVVVSTQPSLNMGKTAIGWAGCLEGSHDDGRLAMGELSRNPLYLGKGQSNPSGKNDQVTRIWSLPVWFMVYFGCISLVSRNYSLSKLFAARESRPDTL